MGLFAVLMSMTSCAWPTQCLGMLSLELQDLMSTARKFLLIQFIGKDPDAGKDWGWEEKGATEDEIVGWHHWINGYEFEQTLGDIEGQGSLACCSPWGRRESDMTERLNNNNNKGTTPATTWMNSENIKLSERSHGIFSTWCGFSNF